MIIFLHDAIFNNLQVTIVTLIGFPTPAPVCALRYNTYTVSGDNPPTVYIKVLLLMLSISVSLSWMEYCVITPLGVSGGLHCKVTEVELTENSSELSLLGTTNRSRQYQLTYVCM